MVTGLVTISTVKVTIATRTERVFSAKMSTFITFNHKIRAFTSLHNKTATVSVSAFVCLQNVRL